jgi:hypothetical protein
LAEQGLGVKNQSGPRSRKKKKASELYISKLGFVADRARLIRLAEWDRMIFQNKSAWELKVATL